MIFTQGGKIRCIQLQSRFGGVYDVPHEGPWTIKSIAPSGSVILEELPHNPGSFASRFIHWVDEPNDTPSVPDDWNPAAGMWMTASDVTRRLDQRTWMQIPTRDVQLGDVYANVGAVTDIWTSGQRIGPGLVDLIRGSGLDSSTIPTGHVLIRCGDGYVRYAEHTNLIVVGRSAQPSVDFS